MTPADTKLVTVDEFAKMKDPADGRYELHHGELILVPPPLSDHARIQRRLMLILDRICVGWYVDKEFAFHPSSEYEVWVADVAMTPQQRYDAVPGNKWLDGSPDLIIEVLSPSNTAQELYDRQRICFQGGCREFWVVVPNLRIITVSTPDGSAHTYTPGGEIPLDRFTPGNLPVTDVFTDSPSSVSK